LGPAEFKAWQQQHQQSLGGPQSDLRKKSMATPTKNPTTAEDADVSGVMTPRLFGHDAGASGPGIPHASRHAGPLYAGGDSIEEMNRVLAKEGYPTFDQISNESVRAHYNRKAGSECSPEAHDLDFLTSLSIRESFRAEFASMERELPASGIYSCKFQTNTGNVQRAFTCPRCGDNLRGRQWHRTRIVAILNEPIENAWMGVVKRDVTKPNARGNVTIFEGSHRCHHKVDRCIVAEHIYLETHDQNCRRSQHHKGNLICTDEKPCFGPKVKFFDGSAPPAPAFGTTPAPTAEQLVAQYARSLGQ
jgi:predicted RNA-binding Zn-ribbon protein involved in translation (DUF1610 family)